MGTLDPRLQMSAGRLRFSTVCFGWLLKARETSALWFGVINATVPVCQTEPQRVQIQIFSSLGDFKLVHSDIRLARR
jgi:hypothetical protein